mgnify:CR=1 FL=1
MIEIAILYILNKYDTTIYKLSKLIDEYFFAFIKTSAGTINPALKRLLDKGCVSFVERMSTGGLKTKTFSITTVGKKYLCDLLITFNQKNPNHFINEAKVVLFCSNVLSAGQLIEFKENLSNNLELNKLKLENGLKNEYITLFDLQKKLVLSSIEQIEKLIKLL